MAAQVRHLVLRMLHGLGYGHFGGSLSIVEALAALYGREVRHNPADPAWEGRDYVVLSKGHGAPALYATLALRGFMPEEKLFTLNANGTDLPSHADRNKVEGVEMTTGSMGQGISVAAGIAYGLKADGRPNRVYCIVGDGELNEGQCWEAAQFITRNNLHNLVLLVDDNKRQLDGWTADISGTANFAAKFTAFGFHAENVPGHDAAAIAAALARAREVTDAPTVLVLDTVKGAGVPYIAELADNHHVRLDEAGKDAVADAMTQLADQIEGVTR